MLSAYLLVSHGSRDPRPQIAVERLAYLVRQQLETVTSLAASASHHSFKSNPTATALLTKPPSPLVATATLELASIPLHQRIQQIARQAESLGLKRLKILPLFLLPGVHVKEDLPSEVAIAQKAIGSSIKIKLCPYLGSYSEIYSLLAQRSRQLNAEARIIISHGSRRLGGNAPIEVMAAQLQAITAYWSIAPSLADQVEILAKKGERGIIILPYFLFTGGITDAIAQQTQQLETAFPQIQFNLGQPLGATPELADLIVQEIV